MVCGCSWTRALMCPRLEMKGWEWELEGRLWGTRRPQTHRGCYICGLEFWSSQPFYSTFWTLQPAINVLGVVSLLPELHLLLLTKRAACFSWGHSRQGWPSAHLCQAGVGSMPLQMLLPVWCPQLLWSQAIQHDCLLPILLIVVSSCESPCLIPGSNFCTSISLPSPSLPSFLETWILQTLGYLASSFLWVCLLFPWSYYCLNRSLLKLYLFNKYGSIAPSYHFNTPCYPDSIHSSLPSLPTLDSMVHPSTYSFNLPFSLLPWYSLGKTPSLVKSNFLPFLAHTKQANVAGKKHMIMD